MPKVAEELNALDVKRLTHPGGKRNVLCSVGGVPGLYLQLTPNGGRSWVLRVKVGTLRRDLGLGGFPGVTLSQARDKAREARAKIDRGIDPVEERKATKAALVAAQRRGLTFADAVDKALAAKLEAHPLEVGLRGGGHHRAADGRRAREGHLVDLQVRGEVVALSDLI